MLNKQPLSLLKTHKDKPVNIKVNGDQYYNGDIKDKDKLSIIIK